MYIIFLFHFVLSGVPFESQVDLYIKSKNADNFYNRRRKFMKLEDPRRPCYYEDYYFDYFKFNRPNKVRITQFDHTGEIKENGHIHYNYEKNISNGIRIVNPPDICVGYTGVNINPRRRDDYYDNIFNRKILLEYEDDGRDIIKRDLRRAFNEQFENKDLMDIDNDTTTDISDLQNRFEQIYSY